MNIPLIAIKDELYHVIRLIPEHSGIDTNLFKGYTNTTHVFTKYIFINTEIFKIHIFT